MEWDKWKNKIGTQALTIIYHLTPVGNMVMYIK